MKVVIAKKTYGFNLTEKAVRRYCELRQIEIDEILRIDRDDPYLIQTIEELGEEAWLELKIVEIPDGVRFRVIQEYDADEWVACEYPLDNPGKDIIL